MIFALRPDTARFTVWLLNFWACQTAATRRAQRGEAAVNRRKLGV
jgi:hypothetical protein